MNKKINEFLVLIVTIAVITLFSIQYYLVKSTYTYRVAQFRSEVEKKTDKIIKNFTAENRILSDIDIYHNKLNNEYFNKKISRNKLMKSLVTYNPGDSITQILDKEFRREIPFMDIDFALIARKYIIKYDTSSADTIFNKSSNMDNKIYGTLDNLNRSFISESFIASTSGLFTNKKGEEVRYTLLTQNDFHISIKRWEWIVLKRMSMFFILIVISIIIILGAIFYTLNALVKQKKINDVKSDLIDNITHEFRTPLTTLSIAADTLYRAELIDNKDLFIQVIDTIKRQSLHLKKLMDQVIHSSLGAHEIILEKAFLDHETYFNALIADQQLSMKDVTIKSSVAPITLDILIDKFHFTTAIINIVNNAVKYGASKILFTTTYNDSTYTIEIEDDGYGIEKDNLIRIFDKFFRVETGNIRNTKGLGLGLYYVKQIIEAHDGTIMVKSVLTKGTKFTINIPNQQT
ncbi:sensor histidine kinase [Aquimarina sp. 2-A2]|uniref:sensor histidine kinase n=1 Tax=Aquimarina sp. 2-A2 TaxID=3382644 RepID=UPI00387F265B